MSWLARTNYSKKTDIILPTFTHNYTHYTKEMVRAVGT